jgi:uncharacterized protein GlcG (DUF336 family)
MAVCLAAKRRIVTVHAGRSAAFQRTAQNMISRNYWAALGILALALPGEFAWAATPVLTAADVATVIQQAVKATPAGVSAVVAVSDREGYILAVYGTAGAPGGFTEINAIDKAGTAAYLSSDGEAFTSRTAGFIIQPHFPPGIANTGTGPLTGVGLSSLPFSDINHFRNPLAPALGIANTSLSGNPGGMPLYKGGVLVGGVGVDTNTVLAALVYVNSASSDEDIAVSAQTGYTPPSSILATQVLLNGIRLPYADFSGSVSGPLPALVTANFDPAYPHPPDLIASTGVPFQTLSPNPFPDIPGGQVRNPIISSPSATLVNGQARLSAAEVTTILHQAAVRASQTRGAIRNPIGPAEVFIVVVDYYTSTTVPNAPVVLGSFRTPDATIFSYDVAAQKARTSLFLSNNVMAMSARAVGFLAQGTYPPGIDGTSPGPYGPPSYRPSNPAFPAAPLFPLPFGLQTAVSILPNAGIPLTPINGFLPNGITIFPGGFPLYRNGVLIGAVGVSGDGVDQDDLISAAATVGFEAPNAIRSDEYTFRGARLPYAKFPQSASL